eukprot:2562469-Rhodomonas_salina.1
MVELTDEGAHWRDMVWRRAPCGCVGTEHVTDIAAMFFHECKYDAQQLELEQAMACPPDREMPMHKQ